MYELDNAGAPTKMNYTSDGATRLMLFEPHIEGRRTGTWMQSNASHTVWTARMFTE
jgi:hypothetical protein